MIRAALFGAGITLVLIVIPIVHFLTVWFASFIGGFVAGSRVAADDGGALVIGGLMAALLVLPILGILLGASALLGFDISLLALMLIGLLLTLYVGGLGVLGAAVGGAAARKQQATRS